MTRHGWRIPLAGVLAGLFWAAAPAAGASATATVNVTITVLPYAEVTISQQAPLTVTVSEGQTGWTADFGGTVVCNCAVSLVAAVTPPAGAPSGWTWVASTKVPAIATPGRHDYTAEGNKLLTVAATGDPAHAGSFDLTFIGRSLAAGQTPEAPLPGNVVVTVMPQ